MPTTHYSTYHEHKDENIPFLFAKLFYKKFMSVGDFFTGFSCLSNARPQVNISQLIKNEIF